MINKIPVYMPQLSKISAVVQFYVQCNAPWREEIKKKRKMHNERE
jgi:hypothetical protein